MWIQHSRKTRSVFCSTIVPHQQFQRIRSSSFFMILASLEAVQAMSSYYNQHDDFQASPSIRACDKHSRLDLPQQISRQEEVHQDQHTRFMEEYKQITQKFTLAKINSCTAYVHLIRKLSDDNQRSNEKAVGSEAELRKKMDLQKLDLVTLALASVDELCHVLEYSEVQIQEMRREIAWLQVRALRATIAPRPFPGEIIEMVRGSLMKLGEDEAERHRQEKVKKAMEIYRQTTLDDHSRGCIVS